MKIALVGNQNSGKTTLFNVLTGMNSKVGNWPGVTIEKKTGTIRNTNHEITDLPGIYSLSPYSVEEDVSRKFIFDEKEETVLNYLNSFSFGSLKPFWTISTNNFRVLFLFTLKDFRIAIVLDDQTIKIYDIVTQKCDITIQREKNSHCMCAQLDNGSTVSWEEKKKMIIYSITKDS